MGNCKCKEGNEEEDDIETPNIIMTYGLDGDPTDHKEPSAVIQWEQRQQELNMAVMEKMREEFHNRPDNFILNLLIASVQFYSNYNKEKVEIGNHIREREIAFNHKLEASKRKVLFMGGHEEISGTHVLYQPMEHPYMEMPTPLQFFLVHDNIDLYPENQYQELQGLQYTDLDGPGYRFCTEYSKRHPGYIRLRCVDIIPGVTRSNTYEDIYGYLKPADESELDPVVDPRPLRRSSLISHATTETVDSPRCNSHSDFEDSDEERNAALTNQPLPSNLNTRRSSGVLPHNYPDTAQLSRLISAMKAAEGRDGSNVIPNGDIRGGTNDQPRNLSERRPSGVFPRVGPEMRQLRLKSPLGDTTDSRAVVRRLTCVQEEDEEEEEDEEVHNDEEETSSRSPELLTVVVEEQILPQNETEHKQETVLHARLNEGCFINRNIKIKDPSDAYGISTKTERRTYFSSERYMECFEDDFEDVAKVLQKEDLVDTSQRQGAAVLTSELMIEEIGPKYHVEFIPTLLLKEWPQCAFEWRLRQRTGRLDSTAKIMYKWPKDINIQEAVQVGCNLVPMGHYNSREPNRVMKIEWQIQFTKAEQILLRSLGHTQMRLLLWVEYLLRDHLPDVPCLQNQHLRYILFWMCEHNFKDWQEPRLGIKLKAFLKTLYNSLSSESLPHYFITSCNMMTNIPEKYIRQAQATVKKMKENLPIYVMHTMSRMRMASEFYPRLNIRKLYKLVTMETFGIEQLNPHLLQLMEERKQEENDDNAYRSSSDDDADGDAEEKRQLHEMRRKRKEKVTGHLNKGINTTPQKRPSIALDTKVQKVSDLRAGRILLLFGRHFLSMARASNRARAYPQAYSYLLLAGNMATLLDETGNNNDAVMLRKTVEQLNVASRGGVKDMLGSSWSVNEQHDLIPSGGSPRGSNWEMNKPPPQPSPDRNLKFGFDRTSTIPSLQTLNRINRTPEKTLSAAESDLDVTDLPSNYPSSLPSSPSLPTTPTSPQVTQNNVLSPSECQTDSASATDVPDAPKAQPQTFVDLREGSEDSEDEGESTDF